MACVRQGGMSRREKHRGAAEVRRGPGCSLQVSRLPGVRRTAASAMIVLCRGDAKGRIAAEMVRIEGGAWAVAGPASHEAIWLIVADLRQP